jgi:transcription initiation factor TFIIIB Brf1 subunit/transcription initiation factor TFIIB
MLYQYIVPIIVSCCVLCRLVWQRRLEDSPTVIRRVHHEQREKNEQRKQETIINGTQGNEGREEIEKENKGYFCKRLHALNLTNWNMYSDSLIHLISPSLSP